MKRPKHPIKLDDSYPCRGRDADDREVVYDDLLSEGDRVGEFTDSNGNVYGDALVVRRDDGLWVELAAAQERKGGAS